jgi:hypothetical protein
MLKNLDLDLITQKTADASANLIPDPWGLPRPAPQGEADRLGEVATEFPLSIAPAGNPDALQINEAKAKPAQVLLQDWLKLKAEDAKQLAIQLQEALGLLCWIEQPS